MSAWYTLYRQQPEKASRASTAGYGFVFTAGWDPFPLALLLLLFSGCENVYYGNGSLTL